METVPDLLRRIHGEVPLPWKKGIHRIWVLITPSTVTGRRLANVAFEDTFLVAIQIPPSAKLVVQPALMDAKVLDDPLGLEASAVRANGTQVLQNLLVGDSVIRQIGADAYEGNREFGPVGAENSYSGASCDTAFAQSFIRTSSRTDGGVGQAP